jgi:hypothetical protein
MLDDRTSERPTSTNRACGCGTGEQSLRLLRTSATRPNVGVPARRRIWWAAAHRIGVGTLDLFHDEDVEYAERLRAQRAL